MEGSCLRQYWREWGKTHGKDQEKPPDRGLLIGQGCHAEAAFCAAEGPRMEMGITRDGGRITWIFQFNSQRLEKPEQTYEGRRT
jgi:hypothetical protein